MEPHHVAAAAARQRRRRHRPHRLGGERGLAAGHGAAQPDAAGTAWRGSEPTGWGDDHEKWGEQDPSERVQQGPGWGG